jgi:hypothetical protein
MPPVVKFTFPEGTSAADFAIEELLSQFDGQEIYMSKGSYADEAAMDAIVEDTDILDGVISDVFDSLGELAEDALTYDSKAAVLKTHNRSLPGKRTTTVSIKINGISNKTRSFLESSTFSGVPSTLLARNLSPDMVIIFNGMSWTYSHGGKTGGLNYGTLECSFDGSTVDKLYFAKDIPAPAEPEE